MKRFFCLFLCAIGTVLLADTTPEPAGSPQEPTAESTAKTAPATSSNPVASGEPGARGSSASEAVARNVSRPGMRQAPKAVPISWDSVAEMNRYFVFRFVHTEGLGSSRMPAPYMSPNELMRVTLDENSLQPATTDGSKSDSAAATTKKLPAEHFLSTDESTSAATSSTPDRLFRIDSLELIGIAKHDRPVAYNQKATISGRNGQANIRQLSEIETEALAELKSGKDVVTDGAGKERSVIGAIRAGKACLDCHEGYKNGDLLGAFTYRLTQAPPVDVASIASDQKVQMSLRNNQRAIEQGTVIGHLESARIALQSASARMDKATADAHGPGLQKLNSALERAQAKLAYAMTYVEEHPDLNPTGPRQRVGGPPRQEIKFPDYAPRLLVQLTPNLVYSGTPNAGPNSESKTIAISREDDRGIRIDQDGKGIGSAALSAIGFLNEAQGQLSGPLGMHSSGDKALDDLKAGIDSELESAVTAALAVVDYVHDHVSGPPTVPFFTGRGFRGTNNPQTVKAAE